LPLGYEAIRLSRAWNLTFYPRSWMNLRKTKKNKGAWIMKKAKVAVYIFLGLTTLALLGGVVYLFMNGTLSH
jgi:hypothetical protein